MSKLVSSESSTEIPRPGVVENVNGALAMVDGALIFIALMAERGDLALLAVAGLTIGSVTCLRLIDARYRLAQKSKNLAPGDGFWESSA